VLLLQSTGSSGLHRGPRWGGGRGWSLLAICEKKAQFLPGQVYNSFSGRDICYPGLCLRCSNSEQTREIRICPDSQAALKSLQAVRTSPLIQQCQKELNDISTRHVVGLYWVPGHAGVRGNEIADEFSRSGTVPGFLEPQPALGVSRRDIQKRFSRWLINQH